MKRVPGPRRVVVSFQFGGLGEDVFIWIWDLFSGSGSDLFWRVIEVNFVTGVSVECTWGEKKRSSVCQRGISNSEDGLSARMVIQ